MQTSIEIAPSLPVESRVTIIDDEEEGGEALIDFLEDYGFSSTAIKGKFGNQLDAMISAIADTKPDFVICDNRLQPRQMAQFYGVSVVQALSERHVPAMLLTTFASPDRVKLRKSRFEVPVIVDREAFTPKDLHKYYEVCRRELSSDPVDHRRPHRTIIRVEKVTGSPATHLDVVVPAWRPDHALTIPVSCVSEDIRNQLSAGVRLFGEVNIGASHEDELFFHNVASVAPDVPESLL